MGVGASLYLYVVVVQKFTFAISSYDEFLLYTVCMCRFVTRWGGPGGIEAYP